LWPWPAVFARPALEGIVTGMIARFRAHPQCLRAIRGETIEQFAFLDLLGYDFPTQY
jgi:hypothetical protein